MDLSSMDENLQYFLNSQDSQRLRSLEFIPPNFALAYANLASHVTALDAHIASDDDSVLGDNARRELDMAMTVIAQMRHPFWTITAESGPRIPKFASVEEAGATSAIDRQVSTEEVAELVRWLRAHADEHDEESDGTYTRIANLLTALDHFFFKPTPPNPPPHSPSHHSPADPGAGA
jgi:hypothetical protein